MRFCQDLSICLEQLDNLSDAYRHCQKSSHLAQWRIISSGLWVVEETRGPESGPANSGFGVDPLAMAMALSGAVGDEAASFLKKQSALAAALDLTHSEKSGLARR